MNIQPLGLPEPHCLDNGELSRAAHKAYNIVNAYVNNAGYVARLANVYWIPIFFGLFPRLENETGEIGRQDFRLRFSQNH